MRPRLVALVLLLAVLGAFAAGAQAAPRTPPPDSLAPPGAAHNWLPKEGWVWMHWLPFSERELTAAMGTDAAGLRALMADDTHTPAALARRRGWTPRALARNLTRRFDGHVPPTRLAALRRRAERVLTQGHLAQHVLFHTFHGPAIPHDAEAIFGLGRPAFLAARQQGLTPLAIAAQHGRTPAAVRSSIVGLLTGEARRGVETRSEPADQSRRMLRRQLGDLDCWLRSPLPKLDPNNPFGGRNGDAGSALGDLPAPRIPGCDGMATAMH